MRLTDLDPHFVRYDAADGEILFRYVDSIADAQGVTFLCPKCFAANGGHEGTHTVVCWSRSRGVPDSATPGPGRWMLVGTSFENLTLNGDGGSRSVLLKGDCCWHGFVTNGEVTDA